MAGRVAANLNYTASLEVINASLRKAGIRTVITSRKVMEKLSQVQRLDAEFVYLEDLRDKVTRGDKLAGALAPTLRRPGSSTDILGLHQDPRRRRAHRHLHLRLHRHAQGRHAHAPQHRLQRRRRSTRWSTPASNDVVLGIVPFFHSLGFTVTLWGPLLLDIRVAYHFSPLEAKQIGKLAAHRKATILLATPTFLRSYLKRCEPEDLKSLEVVVAGAEKLPIPLCDAFEQKFGVRPVEGYGTTELSPLVSVNVPPSRSQSPEVDCKEGSVGRPVPGVAAKIVDPETLRAAPRRRRPACCS